MKERKLYSVIFIVVFLSVLLCPLLLGGTPTPEEPIPLTVESEYRYYYHPTHGYTIRVDGGLTLNATLSELVTVFENDALAIEVYHQPNENLSFATYTLHGNRFLENEADHHLQFEGKRKIGERDVYVTQWYRDGLQRVEHDKNHYITYDIEEKDAYYTIFVKSAFPIPDTTRYDELVKSFKLCDAAPVDAETIAVKHWRSEAVDVKARGWDWETRRFYARCFGEDARLQWGIFERGTSLGKNAAIYDLEERLDYSFDYILCYSHYYKDPSTNPYVPIGKVLADARKDGKVVELTLLMNAQKEPGNDVYDILKGEYDEHLHAYAKSIADFGHPVLFRLNNEMNTDWCRYSAYFTSKDTDIYKEVYRYIYGIFEEEGANRNTLWVWNPNGRTFPAFTWNHMLMYYPGDEYVDIVGMTGYNTGTYYEAYGEHWESFSSLYGRLYREYGTRFAQPFMLTEFACGVVGGDKVAWVKEMFDLIGRLDRIKVAIWWDHVDYDSDGMVARDYRIDEPYAVLEVFRSRLAEYQ